MKRILHYVLKKTKHIYLRAMDEMFCLNDFYNSMVILEKKNKSDINLTSDHFLSICGKLVQIV